jgi:hypothetical protein
VGVDRAEVGPRQEAWRSVVRSGWGRGAAVMAACELGRDGGREAAWQPGSLAAGRPRRTAGRQLMRRQGAWLGRRSPAQQTVVSVSGDALPDATPARHGREPRPRLVEATGSGAARAVSHAGLCARPEPLAPPPTLAAAARCAAMRVPSRLIARRGGPAAGTGGPNGGQPAGRP